MSAPAALAFLSIVLLDGGVAAAILLAATGLGVPIVRLLGLQAAPPRWQLLLAAGLGTGALALLVFALGSCGILSRGPWIAIVCVFAAIACGRLVRYAASGARTGSVPDPGPRSVRWLWAAAGPFLLLALCAATCPPGYLWPSEGNGYDVLEYHFGAPKEWFVAGRIEFLPHNIYSNFPFNAEMLYLLSFILAGSPVAGVYVAQLVNVLLAVLAVAGAWLAGREFGRLPGIVGGLALATCPFLTWLSGMAYVENGMLAMATLSLACLVRVARAPAESAARWAVASGLLAGFACGFKYTAVPTVALPMLVAWLIAGRSRARAVAAFAVATAVSFAPWAVRNFANTGNPAFPLARSVFHERPGIWSDEAAERWEEGHRPDPSDRSPGARVASIGHRVVANPLYGLPIFALAALGAIIGARRSARLVAAAAASGLITVAVGAATTHLVDRFAIAILSPLALLAALAANGRAAPADSGPPTPARLRSGVIFVALVLIGAVWNLVPTVRLFREARVFDVAAFGQTEWMTSGQWPAYAHVPKLNEIAAAGGRVLMLGDARAFYIAGRPGYCVVFNSNPFAEAVATWRADPAAMQPGKWLRWQGYSHLYVDWGEIGRLSRSRYGFWPGMAELRPEDYERMGLRAVASFTSGGRRYATLYRVDGE